MKGNENGGNKKCPLSHNSIPNSAELKKRIERFQRLRDNILGQVLKVIVGP